MSRITKFALLTLAAFIVLGFTIPVNAERPDRLQSLTSAPLSSWGIYCLVANMTDAEIAADIDIYTSSGQVVDNTVVLPAHQLGGDGHQVNFTPGYCVVSWEGQKDDVRATFCAQENDPYTQTCLGMN